jgi:serine/threonine protein phosphatase 1
MNFIIGDIHGEYNKLKKLINFILTEDSNPRLIFIGDYLDKGEDVTSTLDYLLSLQALYECHFLWGNHEYLWYNYLNNEKEITNYLIKYGGQSTINSFKKKNLIDTYDLLLNKYDSFFKSLIPYWEDRNYVISHSGIPPIFYDTKLAAIPLKELLFNRYEFINHQNLFNGNYQMIFGHTGFYSPYIDSFKIGIDTGACYLQTQPLTAFCVDNNNFYNSNCCIKKLSDFNLNQCPSIVRIKI